MKLYICELCYITGTLTEQKMHTHFNICVHEAFMQINSGLVLIWQNWKILIIGKT
jgi:hypothetical protein